MLDFYVFASTKGEDQDHGAYKDEVFYMTHVLNDALYQPSSKGNWILHVILCLQKYYFMYNNLTNSL